MDGNKNISHYPILKDFMMKKCTPKLQVCQYHVIQKH